MQHIFIEKGLNICRIIKINLVKITYPSSNRKYFDQKLYATAKSSFLALVLTLPPIAPDIVIVIVIYHYIRLFFLRPTQLKYRKKGKKFYYTDGKVDSAND